MGGDATQRICAFCGSKDAPARCSRCLSSWFCGPECQRGAWPQHKLICAKQRSEKSSGFVWGQASDELLWNSRAELAPEKALQKVSELSQAQDWGGKRFSREVLVTVLWGEAVPLNILQASCCRDFAEDSRFQLA